jgi:4a-hydroxytetrahydrobiopterin dehydratase
MSSRALLTDAQISDRLARLPTWRRDGQEIRRTVKLGDFAAAIAFVNGVAEIAEEEDHHPDITIRWNRVTLTLSTHDSGGITRRDLEVAARIEALAVESARNA